MKRIIIALSFAVLLLGSCAKTSTTGLNDDNKRYFDAWISVNHPDIAPTTLGSYIIDDKPGDGDLIGTYEDNTYVYVKYTSWNLDGTVSASTEKKVSQQVGDYVATDYYGPEVWSRQENTLSSGIDEIISTMRVGGVRTAVIPGWLFTSDKYDTAKEYLENVSGDNRIYQIEIVDAFSDIDKWETDSIATYLSHNFPDVSPSDSLVYGFYYKQVKAPTSTSTFPHDTTIYINYIGRLLDGSVFDTNIKDTAKFYGLYDASSSYEPTQINWYGEDEDYTSMTMTSDESSMITGFAYCLDQMKAHEKGTAIFYSPLGYSYSGSGTSIPPYSPLRFDIEIVDKED